MRKVFDMGIPEYMRRKAVTDYRRGKISIGKAAEVAGISIAELYKVLGDEDIPIRINTTNLKESLRSDLE